MELILDVSSLEDLSGRKFLRLFMVVRILEKRGIFMGRRVLVLDVSLIVKLSRGFDRSMSLALVFSNLVFSGLIFNHSISRETRVQSNKFVDFNVIHKVWVFFNIILRE